MNNAFLKANHEVLRHGYEYVVKSISSPKDFYARIAAYTLTPHPPAGGSQRLTRDHVSVLFVSMWKLGVQGQGKRYYWKLLATSFFRNPKTLPLMITMMVYGLHFRRMGKAVQL
jgi:hypothetical protein